MKMIPQRRTVTQNDWHPYSQRYKMGVNTDTHREGRHWKETPNNSRRGGPEVDPSLTGLWKVDFGLPAPKHQDNEFPIGHLLSRALL